MIHRTFTTFEIVLRKGAPNTIKHELKFIIDGFGFLISRNESIGFAEFADRIAKNYDATNPRTHHVIGALRQIAQNQGGGGGEEKAMFSTDDTPVVTVA